jgi:hypothetical protein
MTTASTDAHTDMAPLIPHRNAVGAFGRNDAIFIPIGKGIPIRKPMGTSMAVAAAMRTGVVDESKRSMTIGVTKAKATSNTMRGTNGHKVDRRRCGLPSRWVARLPMPLDRRRENSTTERA